MTTAPQDAPLSAPQSLHTTPLSDRLPSGVSMASPWRRLGGYFLEILLMLVTLFVGWLVWAIFTSLDGQTPAKRVLGMRVIRFDRFEVVGFATMFWMRGLVAGFVAGLVIPLTLGLVLLMPFFQKNRQNIWDLISNTLVVVDR